MNNRMDRLGSKILNKIGSIANCVSMIVLLVLGIPSDWASARIEHRAFEGDNYMENKQPSFDGVWIIESDVAKFNQIQLITEIKTPTVKDDRIIKSYILYERPRSLAALKGAFMVRCGRLRS